MADKVVKVEDLLAELALLAFALLLECLVGLITSGFSKVGSVR